MLLQIFIFALTYLCRCQLCIHIDLRYSFKLTYDKNPFSWIIYWDWIKCILRDKILYKLICLCIYQFYMYIYIYIYIYICIYTYIYVYIYICIYIHTHTYIYMFNSRYISQSLCKNIFIEYILILILQLESCSCYCAYFRLT